MSWDPTLCLCSRFHLRYFSMGRNIMNDINTWLHPFVIPNSSVQSSNANQTPGYHPVMSRKPRWMRRRCEFPAACKTHVNDVWRHFPPVFRLSETFLMGCDSMTCLSWWGGSAGGERWAAMNNWKWTCTQRSHDSFMHDVRPHEAISVHRDMWWQVSWLKKELTVYRNDDWHQAWRHKHQFHPEIFKADGALKPLNTIVCYYFQSEWEVCQFKTLKSSKQCRRS